MDTLSPAGTSLENGSLVLIGGASGAADWKNFCRAAWVLWAEAVQGWGAGLVSTGFGTKATVEDSTEEWCGARRAVLLSVVGRSTEPAGPVLIPATGGSLTIWVLWWALHMKLPGSFPTL